MCCEILPSSIIRIYDSTAKHITLTQCTLQMCDKQEQNVKAYAVTQQVNAACHI